MDSDFFTFISDYDLIFLDETWISDKDKTNIDIHGFSSEHIYGNKTSLF